MKNLILIFGVFLFAIAKGQSDSIAFAKINGEVYKAVYNHNGTLLILNHVGKPVFSTNKKTLYDEGFWKLEFKDFDGDGYKDVVVEYYSNVPDCQDLILYDKQTRRFVLIKDFPDFPAPVHLKGTNLYYSYHRSGCADNNWDSDLFKIVNFKIVKIGNISGQDCVDPPDKPGIFICKINGKNELLVKKYPLSEIENFKYSKWGFIAWYWKRNCYNFNASN
ncbi:MAG: hypothetical protein JST19_07220 [Bacteroidetes bacterium]|nr:hypothetical protein [Bacteroidota bacterium]